MKRHLLGSGYSRKRRLKLARQILGLVNLGLKRRSINPWAAEGFDKFGFEGAIAWLKCSNFYGNLSALRWTARAGSQRPAPLKEILIAHEVASSETFAEWKQRRKRATG